MLGENASTITHILPDVQIFISRNILKKAWMVHRMDGWMMTWTLSEEGLLASLVLSEIF